MKFQNATILKASAKLGLIFGFAMITKARNAQGDLVPFNDDDDDQFTDQGMLEACTDFAKSSRVACTMHARDAAEQPIQDGGVIHHFPLTEEIAKALDIVAPVAGLLVALAPDNPDTVARAERGDFTGFSIGGKIIEAEHI